MPEGKYGQWELIEPKLGEGGQSDVYRARTPGRVAQRKSYLKTLMDLSGQGFNEERAQAFAMASRELARDEDPSELGALKRFKIREGGAPAAERLKAEIKVLRENRLNLPKLLDASEDDQWLVTEYFPGGTLEDSAAKYRGQPVIALRAFRSLVETVSNVLHADKIVHRDIKPANVFIATDGRLVLGDFGIVFLPDRERLTITDERVGPRDYMPLWGDSGERLEKVHPNFDVYMLGKLLWCMIAGRLRLPRECHRWPEYDLAAIFPRQKTHMNLINSILDKCLVDRPTACLASATELLAIVDQTLSAIDDGVLLLDDAGQPILPCNICKRGFYQEHSSAEVRFHQVADARNMPMPPIHLRLYVCNVCTHYAFFAPGNPTEAAKRGWTPWVSPKR